MELKKGCAYYIDDAFFVDAGDPSLMQNKGANKRPLYYCLQDDSTGLLLMVPMSTQIEKYAALYEQKTDRYGRCLTIVLDVFDRKPNAFLLQNVVPLLEKYVVDVHSRQGIPVPLHGRARDLIESNMREILQLRKAKVPIVFTDIDRITERMLAIKERDTAHREVATDREGVYRGDRRKRHNDDR